MGYKTDLYEEDWDCYRCKCRISSFTNVLITNNSWGSRWTYCPTCALEKGHNTYNLKPFDERREGKKITWETFPDLIPKGRLP